MARNWTAEDVTRLELARQGARMAQKPSKYRNVKTVVGGEKFDSKREAAYWLGLLARLKAGEVRNIERQRAWDLLCPSVEDSSRSVIVARYIADFVFEERRPPEDGWFEVVADAKGMRTQMYLLKRKWLELQEGIVIREV